MLEPNTIQKLMHFQKDEITEYYIYRHLARVQKSPENRQILERIADDEKRHYERWKTFTNTDVAPNRTKIFIFYWIAKLLGLTFAVKLMEQGEASAQQTYAGLASEIEEMDIIAREEHEHEDALLAMLDEERLRYVGSIVLGLNDALVELTGALAGLTLALQNTKLIALTGLITGIAASFSMAASEYLSTKTEGSDQSPLKAAIYTGVTYIITVIALIMPYLILSNFYMALVCTLCIAVGIIALFNYYTSVAKDLAFRQRFLEMAGLSLGVAALSFLVGLGLRLILHVDI